ncbi:hypothetical protein T08_7276 [Trichinella sp. T8]|nr:hypothetical protein T08_7276 [Trichinella sp. T8]
MKKPIKANAPFQNVVLFHGEFGQLHNLNLSFIAKTKEKVEILFLMRSVVIGRRMRKLFFVDKGCCCCCCFALEMVNFHCLYEFSTVYICISGKGGADI